LPREFAFPPCIANPIVSETLANDEVARKMDAAKLLGMLRPYGGVACLEARSGKGSAWELTVAAAELKGASFGREGAFALLRRVDPIPGSACWTHESADPQRSFYSRDTLVKPPLGVLWYGGGPDQGFTKTKGLESTKPQVAGGRLIAHRERDHSLCAMDVYTGRLLWRTAAESFTRFASMAHGLYVAAGDTCSVLDAATGIPLKRFKYAVKEAGDAKPIVSDLRVTRDVVLIGVAFEKTRSVISGYWDNAAVVALDRKTGR